MFEARQFLHTWRAAQIDQPPRTRRTITDASLPGWIASGASDAELATFMGRPAWHADRSADDSVASRRHDAYKAVVSASISVIARVAG
jgi:hypothetical protein